MSATTITQTARTIADAAIAGRRALTTMAGLTYLLDNLAAEDEDEAMRLPVEHALSAMSASVMEQHRIDTASTATIWEATQAWAGTQAELEAAVSEEIGGDARIYALNQVSRYYGEAAAEGHAL